jgi:hypothetical protein
VFISLLHVDLYPRLIFFTFVIIQVKELMHHLYLVARGHLQRLIPKEVRMLQHILSIEDPTQRFAALSESFAPSEESVDKDREDFHT